jgi:uncharacterized protein YdeI (YjbR/CyaY-like superfamily)
MKFTAELLSTGRNTAGFEVPEELAAALAADAKAKEFWETLSYSKQQWHVLQVTSAKTDATRDRRIEKSIGMLREGKAR